MRRQDDTCRCVLGALRSLDVGWGRVHWVPSFGIWVVILLLPSIPKASATPLPHNAGSATGQSCVRSCISHRFLSHQPWDSSAQYSPCTREAAHVTRQDTTLTDDEEENRHTHSANHKHVSEGADHLQKHNCDWKMSSAAPDRGACLT